MDLDGDKGRQLLRTLIQMVMVSHPSLASNALNLLVRHFSQRKEMVQGFRQVGECGLVGGACLGSCPYTV